MDWQEQYEAEQEAANRAGDIARHCLRGLRGAATDSQYIEALGRIQLAIEAERERCARLHESVNPASDEERAHGDPGAGAMGAVVEYRDLIRAAT